MQYAIEINNLSKYYSKFLAVNDLNLKVRKGEIYGLLGPNGSGKTTTIKMICGLLRPSSGTIRLFDKTMPDRSVSHQVAYMPQDTSLYLQLSVLQNLHFFGELYGLPGSEIGERAKKLLSFVDLEKWQDRLVANLSGGMKHRISLACALIHDPEVLFLDEPTVGVDPQLRVSFWEYFNELKLHGATILITTHYMDEARRCDRVGFIREGNLIAEGAPRTLMSDTGTSSLEDAFLKYSAGGHTR
ncbi:MAG: ABC transporter ATP-binding protein [Syntrophales bacterium]|nr:ABC transporter ATP-binding protein [Syntrophales bacterium]